MGETRYREAKDQAQVICEIAKRSFETHTLSEYQAGSWRCGRPNGASAYQFFLFFAPGTITLWGDIGDFVLRHSDHDSLRWFLEADSRDYMLEKVSASRDPKKEFMFGDAMAVLDDLEKGEDRTKRASARRIRGLMSAARDDFPVDQARTWHKAWYVDDSDPESCLFWSPGLLWLWQAAQLFRRLYAKRLLVLTPEDLDLQRWSAQENVP